MKKNLLIFMGIILCLFTLTACNKKVEKKEEPKKKVEVTDASKFKEEYESLNGTENSSGKTIRTIEISSDNPFKYKTEDEIVEMIDNKESFVVYFGFPNCPWCRSVLPTLESVSKELEIDTIYYVNIYDIRDVLEVKNGKVEEKTKGSEGYYKLLDKLDNVLDDYTLTDEDGKKIDTKEKRIYAPNVVVVINGKAKKLTTGISKKQDDAYMELTDEMKEETYKDFEKVLKIYKEESSACSLDNKC